MLKIYDTEHNFVAFITNDIHSMNVSEVLETGFKSLTFTLPCIEPYLDIVKEEYYVETRDYEYVVKFISMPAGNEYFEISCRANVEELDGTLFRVFDVFEKSLEQAYNYCLGPATGWKLEYNSIVKTITTLQTRRTTPMKMIRQLAKDNYQELWFDTKNKVLKVYDTMGRANSNVYYSNEIHMRQCAGDSNTANFITVLYPMGKDGLTINDVNGGLEYIENFTYSNKRIEAWWEDKTIERAEILKARAEDYLAENAMPVASYTIDMNELGDDIQLGDTIAIVDSFKHWKIKKRVVAIHRKPFRPEEDAVELQNMSLSLPRLFAKIQKQTDEEIAYIKNILET